MSEQPNISQNSEQIMNDIQSLQQIEQQLFNNLETNTTLTPQEQEKTVEKMNQLSNMRINLYQTLNGVNGFFNNALSSSIGTLQEQTVAIGIVENELNQAKRRLQILEDERINKIRLVEINNYYGEKYAEHSSIMKIIIFTLIPIIILAVLNNKGILPNKIYYFLLIIISLICSYYFWKKMASIVMRDNMNYQEYNWNFDPNSAPSTSTSSTTADPWLSLNVPGTCVGDMCCSDGQTYDSNLNQCVGNSTVTETFMTESMVNKVLTKKQPEKYKHDVNMGYINNNNSTSFINNSKIK